MRTVYLVTAFAVVLTVSLLGFRGSEFATPPMDVFPEWAFPGMKYQPRYRAQGESAFFADGRADRPLPAGVVARGELRADNHLYRGRDASGAYARGFPADQSIDLAFMMRGQERYTIYCAPCHGDSGDGNGITKRYGMGVTPTYHDDRLRQMSEGELYDVITNGRSTMLPYADKLTPEERWAVVAYVRALQRSQAGRPADVVEPTVRQNLGLR